MASDNSHHSSRPLVLHPERARRDGAFILAANHTSPYDVPLLMRHTPRRLDFVNIRRLLFTTAFIEGDVATMKATIDATLATRDATAYGPMPSSDPSGRGELIASSARRIGTSRSVSSVACARLRRMRTAFGGSIVASAIGSTTRA